MTLDLPALSFITFGADPDTGSNPDGFILSYAANAAPDSEIKTHTIGYTVTSTDYPSLTMSGTFQFTVQCPTNVATVTAPTANLEFDLANESPVNIPNPVLSFNPASCAAL